MTRASRLLLVVSVFSICFLALALSFNSPRATAQEGEEAPQSEDASADDVEGNPTPAEESAGERMAGSGSGGASSGGGGGSNENARSEGAALVRDAERHDGLITLYQKEGHVYAELTGSDYQSEYIVLTSIARGIGQSPLLGGMSWSDDMVWVFRKIEDRVHVVRKNVRFRADRGSPEATAVGYAYTDSVLFSLEIKGKGPNNGDLVDLTDIFMSDLPGIQHLLRGYSFSRNKSAWTDVKAFSDNVELEVAATYASSGSDYFDTVPDSRGVSVNVHYSISKVPSNDYTPRIADERVGYFLTAVKDYSVESDTDEFIRYINRWNLQKANPEDAISPPKEPLIFWIENTVPFEYRPAIRAGILEWNKAFEAAGFADAIEVRQQPENADWDPEDINYNTFRWMTSSAGFAMGPSRVNPYTGEILDADIIFDADFLLSWRQDYETITPESIAAMTGMPLTSDGSGAQGVVLPQGGTPACQLSNGMARQLAIGSLAVGSRELPPRSEEAKEELIMQGLKWVVMHEVGHTLGLRHNFKGSALHSIEEIYDEDNGEDFVVSSSVMDYLPACMSPGDAPQGRYYMDTVGVYDIWAIQYGYTEYRGSEDDINKQLMELAARSGERELAYATDGDTRGIDPDPHSNRYDLSSDLLEYAEQQAELVAELMPGLVERVVDEGEDYTAARRAFNILLSEHGQAMYFASRYVGGLYVSRSHRGDEDARPPLEVVDAERQREALELLGEQVFSAEPYMVPPEMYNQLASSTWSHWGTSLSDRPDFPVHEVIAMWQNRVLNQLLSSTTLTRIHDSELKVPAEDDAFTTAELISDLSDMIYSEVDELEEGDYTTRQPAIHSLRRNLQRNYLERLSMLAMGSTSAPADCQTIAYAELAELREKIRELLQGDIELDAYSRAHLTETADRITKVLDASLQLPSP